MTGAKEGNPGENGVKTHETCEETDCLIEHRCGSKGDAGKEDKVRTKMITERAT